MSGGSRLFSAPQALYVLGELLFELRPPAGASPRAGSAPSSATATPTAAAAPVIVLIRAPRRRAHPYHQRRKKQRQCARHEQRQDDRVVRTDCPLVRRGP